MTTLAKKIIGQVRRRIARILESAGTIDSLFKGTLIKRVSQWGRSRCRCVQDSAARHGPYYESGLMHQGDLVRRSLTPEEAVVLRLAIENYREVK